MKEDITQPAARPIATASRCGLVMKEDITQHTPCNVLPFVSCGLVMKEDITQRRLQLQCRRTVVVW